MSWPRDLPPLEEAEGGGRWVGTEPGKQIVCSGLVQIFMSENVHVCG